MVSVETIVGNAPEKTVRGTSMRISQTRAVLGAGTAVLMAIGAGSITPAHAQSAEQKLQEMREQMQDMRERMRELEKQVEDAAETADEASRTSEKTSRQVNDVRDTEKTVQPDYPVTLTVGGRVNQGVLYAEQGPNDQAFVVDNDNSASRFEFNAETQFGAWSSGVEIEISAEVNSTDEIDFGANQGNEDQLDDIGEFRVATWYLEHPRYGHVAVGRGDTAAEDTTFADLSGTTLAAAADVDDPVGGLNFITDRGTDLGDADGFFDTLDDSRDSRILYSTPSFAGVRAHASLNNDAESLNPNDNPAGDGLSPSLALTYAAEIRAFAVEAAAGWRREDTATGDDDIFTGSASVMSPWGISVTLAGSTADIENPAVTDAGNSVDAPTMIYGKLGYQTTVFAVGSTSFSIDYYAGDNGPARFAAPGGALPEATSYGLGAVQKLTPLATELYLGIRRHEVDDVFVQGQEAEVDEMLSVLSGARVRF